MRMREHLKVTDEHLSDKTKVYADHVRRVQTYILAIIS